MGTSGAEATGGMAPESGAIGVFTAELERDTPCGGLGKAKLSCSSALGRAQTTPAKPGSLNDEKPEIRTLGAPSAVRG